MTIIWDWNGTLLDDVEVMIASDNRVFERRGLRRMPAGGGVFRRHVDFHVVRRTV